VLSAVVGYGPFGGSLAEFDAKVPLVGETLGLAGGATWSVDVTEAGVAQRYWGAAVALRWAPRDGVEVLPFYSRTVNTDTEAEPLLFVGGAHLPPEVERGEFYGQSWTDGHGIGQNYGVVANAELAGGWLLKAGAFRSAFEQVDGYADLWFDVAANGVGTHAILADRDLRFASTSGEVRLSRAFDAGARRHTVHVIARARDQARRYGGGDLVEFGTARVGVPVTLARPAFTFGPQTRDEVKQTTGALAYQLRWGRLELGLGAQKTNYRKRVDEPDGASQQGRDAPWLHNASAAWHASEAFAIYAGYARGLEEGGVAPANAVNKDAASPAIRTQQWDAGVRYSLTPKLTLIAGVFDVTKPYFSVDASGVFRRLGEQQSRGLEMSITGQVLPGLNLVAGTVLLDPRVSGEEVDAGIVGRVPVGQTKRLTIVSAEWTVPRLAALSFDATLTSVADRMASTDNRLEIPARSVLDVGARYRLRLGTAPATLRFQVGNVFDKFGWRTNTSGVFVPNAQRRFSVQLAADF
jgi:iron complex outermembrane receptor protein